MNSTQISYSDFLFRRRLETLQTVDDIISDVVTTLTQSNQLDNTYIFYTSDNGYHLGLFGLGLDKRLPYEEDIRLPFYVRGPGIPVNQVRSTIVSNIDIAPTFLELAGLPIPDKMDGQSIVKTFSSDIPQRTQLLIEYHGEDNDNTGLCSGMKGQKVSCFSQNEYQQPPYWNGQPFCSCQDSSNQTYNCLRILDTTPNQQQNIKYCEFQEGIISLQSL